ncbi:glycoside hydrolase family 2 TIM barrel-domain containing protein [Paenibacillus pectinilyticus]|nr:glycoside hydrolase family 2 TIM barrel-domain containing protein [Paenibacillus pectinilyticus]
MITQRLTHNWAYIQSSLGGAWEVWRKDKLNNHYNLAWSEVELPHCFNALDAMDPDVPYYQGQGWYRTLLEVDNPYLNGRTLLHFEGAGQHTEVYVYEDRVGEHQGGYDEFTIDITDRLREGQFPAYYENKVPIAIRCDNTRNLETIPSDVSDFNLYGGLYRYVNLVYVPAVSLETVHVISQVSADRADIQVQVKLYHPEADKRSVRLRLQVWDDTEQEIFAATVNRVTWDGSEVVADFEVDAPHLWSPNAPRLYTCKVTLEDEGTGTETAETVRFGLRYFEFEKKGPFYLNGERLLLHGTHRHEDHAGVGAAMTEEMIACEMRLIKDMGANFIRLGHYQQSRIVLDQCDELGLLVWEEIPWCRGGLGGASYRQQCKDMLTAMITQHRNHPSIILWGLGNENDWEADFNYFDEEAIRDFMRELHALSHELDDTRLTAIRRCEFCRDIVDVYSPSIWAGWYRGVYPEYESYTRAGFENTDRFLHVEWGADNVAGRHVKKPYTGFADIQTGQGADERDGDYLLTGGDPRVSSLGDWSETYFCDMIDWYLRAQQGMPWLTGTAQWSFKDFSTPVRPDSPIPYLNMKGVVERDFKKKEAYYVFQSYWLEKPMIRIYGGAMDVRTGSAEEEQTIRVYSNCSQAELFINGESAGVRTRDVRDYPNAGLRWNVTLLPGMNQVVARGRNESGDVVSDETTFVFQTESWGVPVSLQLSSYEEPNGHVMIEAKAYDAEGVFCADAAVRIHFGLAGSGKLLDNLGTVRGSRSIELANGRACIYMDPRGGASMVSARCEGLRTAFVEVSGECGVRDK